MSNFVDIETLFIVVSLIVLFLLVISAVLFRRVSVRYIEQQMAESGERNLAWDAGYGARHIMLSLAIVWGKSFYSPLFNAESVLKYARKKDCYLAWFYLCSGLAFMVLIVITLILAY